MDFKYTDEKAVLLLIALLKANGIKRIIVSPGMTNYAFVGSVQNDDFFQLYSCVDERSAAYMACGMAAETGEPVVISCTGATAPRNYLPGLTEAYYRKLPVLAVCGTRGESKIGHLHDQQLDRRHEPTDVANVQVWLPFVKDAEDEQYCINEINKAILALRIHGGGPAMINLTTHYSQNMSVQTLPPINKVEHYTIVDNMPELPQGRIAIVVGSHRKFTNEETYIIDNFCASHDAIVVCDHTSGFYGKYAFHASLVFGQAIRPELANVKLCISAGEVSGDYCGVGSISSSVTWRVSEDGAFRNKTNNVNKVFEMSLSQFCQNYIFEKGNKDSYLRQCSKVYNEVYSLIPDLPFSNVWIAQQLSAKLPTNSNIHFGILGSLRAWNYFQLPNNVAGQCNVGGFGIDGPLSSAIGASLASPEKITFCVLGDLAFFYDMNALGNRHIGNNLRILLINNGLGDEFRRRSCPAGFLGEMVRPYIAAEGHYGHKSPTLVKSYAESLGYKYMVANDKQSFSEQQKEFLDHNIKQSIIFEIMIRPEDETDALEIIRHLNGTPPTKSLTKQIKSAIKSAIGRDKLEAIKTLLK